MIVVHKLAHEDEPVQLNPDLILSVERTPDTVITLTNGHKVVVADSPEEVVGRVRDWRVGILRDALRPKQPARPAAPGKGSDRLREV